MESKKHIKFRFEDLEIWKLSVEIAYLLFDLANELEDKKLFRFAEQLRSAGLSMPNNIAEGSGSDSKREFLQFLNIARRSTFENANMIIMFMKRTHVNDSTGYIILEKLDLLSKKIKSFQNTLK